MEPTRQRMSFWERELKKQVKREKEEGKGEEKSRRLTKEGGKRK
jgi:hypothetical protein